MSRPDEDPLRHSKDAALSFFGTFFDDEDVFAAVVNAFAHDVLQAAMVDAASWATQLDAEGVLRLEISGNDVFTVDGDDAIFLLCAGKISKAEIAELGLELATGQASSRSKKRAAAPVVQVAIPPVNFAAAWDALYDRHVDALELALASPPTPDIAKTHSPAVLEALQEILSLALPAPSHTPHAGSGDADEAFETLFEGQYDEDQPG